jgi:hypothetical protein
MYRVIVNESMLAPGLSPTRPFQTQAGAYTVPNTTTLFVVGQQMRIFGQSGVIPGAATPFDDELSDVCGYIMGVNGAVQESVMFQNAPVESAATRQAFESTVPVSFPQGESGRAAAGRTPPAAFNRAAVGAFASTAGQGTSLRPPLNDAIAQQGSGPWTVIAHENSRVSMDLVIYRRILLPVAFFQFQFWGYMVPKTLATYLLASSRPSV